MSESISIQFEDKHMICRRGENLREVLMRYDAIDRDRFGQWGFCKGLSDCGTCTMKVAGELLMKESETTHRTVNDEKILTCRAFVQGDLILRRV